MYKLFRLKKKLYIYGELNTKGDSDYEVKKCSRLQVTRLSEAAVKRGRLVLEVFSHEPKTV